MNEYIKGCYKLQGNLTGPIVRSPCGFNPDDSDYVPYCSVPGSVPYKANKIINVERTLNEDNPDLAWFILTWLDGNGVERSNATTPLGVDKNTTFSIYGYGSDSDNCELSHTPEPTPTPEPPVTEPPDDCNLLSYNPTWLVDGCPRLIAIPGPDKTPPPLVDGSPSPSPSPPPFNPYKYRYVRFVGKGSRTGGLDGIGLSDGNPGTFVGYYIDNDGNISTPWTELEAGDYRYVGTLWNYQVGTGGGKDFIYDSVVNTTDGFDEFEFGGTRITSWTPAVNFYDNLEPIIEGGPQIGTGHGVPWRSQVSVTTNGLAGGYGDFNGYIGDLGSKSKVARPSYTFPSLPDFAVRDALSIRNLSSSPDGIYPYKEAPITLTIKGHWEFSNNAIDIDAIWAGLDE